MREPGLTAHFEITDPGGAKRTVPIWHGTFVLGADRAADVQVVAPGVRPQHLRFVPAEGIVRVEPVAAGATVEVNGEQLFCKDLVDGDVIRVGAVLIRWVDTPPQGTAAPRPVAAPRPIAAPRAPSPKVESPVAVPPARNAVPPRPAAAAGRKGPKAERARAPRSRSGRGGNSWAVVGGSVFVIVLLGYGLLQHFKHSTWPSSPQHYVDLAREQLANRQPDLALATLAFARKDATGAVRVQAEQLEAEIRRLLLETAAMPKVSAARTERDALLAFAARWLKDGAPRPAARELVLRCKQWLANHAEVCANHSDGKELLRAIEELQARYLVAARLDAPEEAADVLFFAQERLSVRWRDYKAAVARLDAFVKANPSAAEVARKRTELLAEGEQWLRGKLDNIANLLARGDTGNARRDLEELDRKSVLPAWEALVAPVRARVAAAR